MILQVHLAGVADHEIGDEIWQESLADAIRAEAEAIAEYMAPAEQISPETLAERLTAEMTTALRKVGDTYDAPDGIHYSLTPDHPADPHPAPAVPRVVAEVLRFEALPLGVSASRRAVVRWSDGSDGEALRWWGDEILFCEGDLIGKTAGQLRRLHFRRDRDYLQETYGFPD